MNNKINYIAGKIIILTLVLMMIMPTTTFAGEHKVSNWDDYNKAVTEGIISQEMPSIIINFPGNEYLGAELAARLLIESHYATAKGNVPAIYSELNVETETTGLALTLDNYLTSITHNLKYKNSKEDFFAIRTILNSQYPIIRTEATDYKKIEAAYNYVIRALGEIEGEKVLLIKEKLIKQGDNAHAVLFSLMMTELGYDNDIASNVGEDKWNLVKVQGYWYHVNAVEEYKCFLTVKSDSAWDKGKHTGKSLATKDYDGTIPKLPQIIYEVGLIKEAIKSTLIEINAININTEDISLIKILEIKSKFDVIEDKIASYKEIKNYLQTEADKLKPAHGIDFDGLEADITSLSDKIIYEKKRNAVIVVNEAEITLKLEDIRAAEKAITMIDNIKYKKLKKLLEDKMDALEKAVAAIIKAEKTKLEVDIISAKEAINDNKIIDLKVRLSERLKIIEDSIKDEIDKIAAEKALKAVEKAEKSIKKEDVVEANELVTLLADGAIKTNLLDRLVALEAVNDVENRLELLENGNVISESDIVNANTKIDKVTPEAVQNQLKKRMKDAIDANVAINLLNTVVLNIKDITAGTTPPTSPSVEKTNLTEIIIEFETANKQIDKIVNKDVKLNQQKRIKDINFVILAIKAVDKVEKSEPLKITDVSLAKDAIAKIDKLEVIDKSSYNSMKSELTKRTTKLENLLKEVVNLALKAAEDSVITTFEGTPPFAIPLKDIASKAEKLVTIAVAEVGKIKDPGIKGTLNIRIDNIRFVIAAIKAVDKVENSLKIKDVALAEDAIGKIVDSTYTDVKFITGIKIELNNRITTLNEKFADEITNAAAAVVAAEVSVKTIPTDKTFKKTILDAETSVTAAEELVKNIKIEATKKELQKQIVNIKLVIDAMNSVDKAEDVVNVANVKTARIAIGKIVDIKYPGVGLGETVIGPIKDELYTRVDIVEKKVEFVDAENLLKIVEGSLKRVDYDKAKKAIYDIDITTEVGEVLNGRREAVDKLITAKEDVENAEEKMKANKDETMNYTSFIEKSTASYNIVNNDNYKQRYRYVLEDLGIRRDKMNTVIITISLVNTAQTSYDGYVNKKPGSSEADLSTAISTAKFAVETIDDKNANFTNIKKSLLSKLKVFRDRLDADTDNSKVSVQLNEIEVSLIHTDTKKLSKSISISKSEIAGVVDTYGNAAVINNSKDLKDRVTAIYDVIAAAEAVLKVDVKDKIKAINNIKLAYAAIDKLSVNDIYSKIKLFEDYRANLKIQLDALDKLVETSTNEEEATAKVKKAVDTKKEADIKLAIEAVVMLKDGIFKDNLIASINGIVTELIDDANTDISTVITSITNFHQNQSVATNVTNAKKTAQIAINVEKLFKKLNTDLSLKISKLNISLSVIENSVSALKAVQQVEKTKTQVDFALAQIGIDSIDKVDSEYKDMITELNRRLDIIKKYIDAENDKDGTAETEVAAAEAKLGLGTLKIDDLKTAQNAVNKVSDNLTKAGLQKRIDAMVMTIYESAAEKELTIAEGKMTLTANPSSIELKNAGNAVNKVIDNISKVEKQKRFNDMTIAITAKSAVERAEAFTDAASVKNAEKAFDNIFKTGSYLEIVNDLSNRISKLDNKLNVSKKVAEAAKLVQKAVSSKTLEDITNAKLAVEGIKTIVDSTDEDNAYKRLKKQLEDLDKSIENQAGNEITALEKTKSELESARNKVSDVNIKITKIIDDEFQEKKIKEAYEIIQLAKNNIIEANASMKKLGIQNKGLLAEIDFVNKELDLAEDNIDVKEAVRLVKISSLAVTKAKDEEQKALAKLDISSARRAIDKIGHNDNKGIKATILENINSIEKKLTSDNDQDLIDIAFKAVYAASDLLMSIVKENKVMEKQDQIDKAIFAAKLSIGFISDSNKGSRDTLTGFINEIESAFLSEKDGIANEERIINAEKSVVDAEAKKGTDQLDSLIRLARLKVKMIRSEGTEAGAKINSLNARLDILEGKVDPNNPTKPGDPTKPSTPTKPNTPAKPGSGGTTPGYIVPTTPLSDNDRLKGTVEPLWGKTNELKKTTPVTALTVQNMEVFRVNESKVKIIELSNILKTNIVTNSKLVVKGKIMNIDSKAYILDGVNNSILVPIKFLGDELGFTVSLTDSITPNGAKRLLLNGFVDGKVKSIVMELGSEYCYVNGAMVKVSSKIVVQGGRTYVPVDLMVEHFGLTFSYYNEGKNVQLIIN